MNESLPYYNVVPLRFKNRAVWTKSSKWLLEMIAMCLCIRVSPHIPPENLFLNIW